MNSRTIIDQHQQLQARTIEVLRLMTAHAPTAWPTAKWNWRLRHWRADVFIFHNGTNSLVVPRRYFDLSKSDLIEELEKCELLALEKRKTQDEQLNARRKADLNEKLVEIQRQLGELT